MATADKVVAVDEYKNIERYVQWFETAEDSTIDSRQLSERDIDYRDGKQTWTASDLKVLKRRKQPPTVINRIKPKVDFLLGEERKQRTDPKAFPRNPQTDEDAANAATDALRYVADCNNFDQLRSECYEDGVVPGAYGCEIIVEPSKKNKKDYNIIINRIPWDRMFFDPHSRARDFSDAKYKGVVVWMDREDALQEFPGSDSILSDTFTSVAQSQTYDDKPVLRWADPKRNRVRVVQIYFLEKGEWHYAYYTKGGFLKGPQKCPYVDEDGGTECPLEFQSAYVDRDGNRYGQVRQWIDIQDEINKRRSKGLHLLNSRQTFGEKGAVENVAKAKEELSKPDGHVEYTAGMKFEIIPTNDMAAGNLQMLAEAKAEIDAQGPNAALAGAEQRDLSGRAINRLQAGSSTEVFPLIDGLRAWQHRIYRQVWNRVKQYWTEEKWIRVTDDENNVRFVGLNKKTTKGEMFVKRLQKEKMPPEQMQEIMQQIQMAPDANEPVIENNVGEIDIDIIMDDVPDTVSIQQEQFEQLVTIYPSVPPQIQPIAFEMLVEASSLRNKKQFLEKLRGGDDPQQAQQQQAQMQQQMQMMQAQLEKVMSEVERNKAAAMRDMATAQATVEGPIETPKVETPDPIHPMIHQENMMADIELKRANAAKSHAQSVKDMAQAQAILNPPPDTAKEREMADKGE